MRPPSQIGARLDYSEPAAPPTFSRAEISCWTRVAGLFWMELAADRRPDSSEC